jgi:hypothetical protein
MTPSISLGPKDLIQQLMEPVTNLPDRRRGKNRQYRVEYTLRSAFSLFFRQLESFFAVSTPDGDEKRSQQC